MSGRRSRRTRGEKPELVPPKSGEEADTAEDNNDETDEKVVTGPTRGRRRGKRVGSSSSLSQLASATSSKKGSTRKNAPSKAAAAATTAGTTTKKKRGRPRGRNSTNRPRSPSPSESSISASEEEEEEEEENDENTNAENGSNDEASNSEDSNDSNNEESENDEDDDDDDAERDTEDDAPKEALTGKKRATRKPRNTRKNTRYCKYCENMVSSRGFMQHERSCKKRAMEQDNKEEDEEGVDTNEADDSSSSSAPTEDPPKKKRGRKTKAKTVASADDASSSGGEDNPPKKKRGRKPKPKIIASADDYESSSSLENPPKRKRGRRSKAKPVAASADDDESLSAAEKPPTKKRGRSSKAKQRAASADDDASLSAPENPPKRRGRPAKSKKVVASVNDSLASAGTEAPKKRGRKPKPKTVAASADESSASSEEQPPKKRGRKPKSKAPASEKTEESEGEDGSDGFSQEDLLPISALALKKPPASSGRGRPVASKKALAAKEKAGPTATAQKKKTPKNSKLSKSAVQAKIAPITNFFAPKTSDSTKEQTKPTTLSKEYGKEEKVEPAKKESSSGGDLEATRKEDGQKTGPNKTTGEAKLQKSTKTNDEKNDGPVKVDDEKKIGSKTDSSKDTTEESKPSETTQMETATGKAISTAEKTLEKKSTRANAASSSRPSRKRKLTMKAAEAAATIASKNEEKKVGNGEREPANERNAFDKEESANEDEKESDSKLANAPLEEQGRAESDTDKEKQEKAESQKDQNSKASIVEAAKSAAAATLALFPLFSAKAKSTGETEAKEGEGKYPESMSTSTVKEATEVAPLPKTTSKVQDIERGQRESQETPLDDTNTEKSAHAAAVSTATPTLKESEATSRGTDTARLVQDKAIGSIEEQATSQSLTLPTNGQPAGQKEQRVSTNSNTVESSERADPINPTDRSIDIDLKNEGNTKIIDTESSSRPSLSTEKEKEGPGKEKITAEENPQSIAIDKVAPPKIEAEELETQGNERMEPGPESSADAAIEKSENLDKSPSNKVKVSNGGEQKAKTQESKPVSDSVSIEVNLDMTGIDRGDEKREIDPKRPGESKQLPQEEEIQNMGGGESKEKGATLSLHNALAEKEAPSSANMTQSKTNLDPSQPQPSSETKDDIASRKCDEEVEVSSSSVENTSQPTVAMEENVGDVGSKDMVDAAKNTEDDSKKEETEQSAELTSIAEVNGEGTHLKSEPVVVQISKNPEEENMKESSTNLSDSAEMPGEAVQDEPAQPKPRVPSSSNEKEPVSDSTRENAVSSRVPEAPVVEKNSNQSADEISQPQVSSSLSAITTIVANESSEVDLKWQQHSTESAKDSSIDTLQLSEVPKSERLNDKALVQNVSNSESSSQSAERSSVIDEASKSQPIEIAQNLESSIDWKETVSVNEKAVSQHGGQPSNVKEDSSAITPMDSERTLDGNKVAIDGYKDTKLNDSEKEVSNEVVTNEDCMGGNKPETTCITDTVMKDAIDEAEKDEKLDISGLKPAENELREKKGKLLSQNYSTSVKITVDASSNATNEDKPAKSIEECGNLSSEQIDAAPLLEASATDRMSVDSEKPMEQSHAIAERGDDEETKDLVSTEVSPKDMEGSKAKDDSLLASKSNKMNVDEVDGRKDINPAVESLLNSAESCEKKSLMDSTEMEIENTPSSKVGQFNNELSSEILNSQEIKSKGTGDIVTPAEASNIVEVDAVPEDPDSTMGIEVPMEEISEPGNVISSPKVEIKVSWVPLSQASRQTKSVKDSPRYIGLDENTTNRVKMLLYTTGSKIHRGRGFERIFGMYWDAVCLRLSRPLNGNASKRCDQAISAFLKSKRLRKIHNKFVMNIMRRALKDHVPYSEISKNIPSNWQDRVKVPNVSTTWKPFKKKTKTFTEGLEDDLLQLSSVPHLDRTTPYKERWEFPSDTRDEMQKNPQEGPTVPIASSCIPGALVVDPMLRETVEASGMKVTDSAMWLLTVALKEHIKNILNDSIEYKKGLKKGELFPQAIHYPNVLASSSNRNRKISKGRSPSISLENGRKKRINSIDLFAALNMLPSGQTTSIGGSVSRMSLEQTFLSGFSSIPSFDTGNGFKDVQGFISNTITEMAKTRKPEEKKAKASNTKNAENSAARERAEKATVQQELTVKKPIASVTTPQSNAAQISSLESPPLENNMSPAVVQTPVLDSSAPKSDVSQLASPEKRSDAPHSRATGNLQGVGNKTSGVHNIASSKAEKPAQKVSAGGNPSHLGPPRSGAGRGAKNLAALMARAAEGSTTSNSNDASQDGEKQNQTNNSSSSSATVNSQPSKPNDEVPNTSNAPKPDNLRNTQPSVPERQTVAPVRRGKGKGFGSKDLAAMRARSMTSTPQTEEADPSKPGDTQSTNSSL